MKREIFCKRTSTLLFGRPVWDSEWPYRSINCVWLILLIFQYLSGWTSFSTLSENDYLVYLSTTRNPTYSPALMSGKSCPLHFVDVGLMGLGIPWCTFWSWRSYARSTQASLNRVQIDTDRWLRIIQITALDVLDEYKKISSTKYIMSDFWELV